MRHTLVNRMVVGLTVALVGAALIFGLIQG